MRSNYKWKHRSGTEATGQLKLADRMEDCCIGQSAVEYEKQTLEYFVAASRLYANFDCPPECFHF